MSTKIYVGNLSPRTTQEEIRNLFTQYGEVDSVDLIMDRYCRESRGFGLVTMNNNGAKEAMLALDKKEVHGQNIKVNEARPREASGRRQSGWGNRRVF
ncbi:MAG: RNA recognition motif domain-containing protein [Gammaproteobacteria bacterium]